MNFDPPLNVGSLVKRYKRFFIDVNFEGKVLTLHCPNTGSMKGLLEEGSDVAFEWQKNPKAKLKGQAKLIKSKETWVGIDTGLANKIFEEAFHKSQIAELRDYDKLEREVKINSQTRLDFCLHHKINKSKLWVEVKSVTLAQDSTALFPDAVTTRGQKHIVELLELVEKNSGDKACMFYVIQRADVKSFRAAHEIDVAYADALKKARESKNFLCLAYVFNLNPNGTQYVGPATLL